MNPHKGHYCGSLGRTSISFNSLFDWFFDAFASLVHGEEIFFVNIVPYNRFRP